jgi:hypothetical protein
MASRDAKRDTPLRRRGTPLAKGTSSKKQSTEVRATRKTSPSANRGVTEYATKSATPYHKAFARWIVTEVGYDPDTAPSKRAAFLRGVSIASAARPKFLSSDYLEEWYEKTGETKRGRKPQTKESVPKKRASKSVADDDFDEEISEPDDEDFIDDADENNESDDDFEDESEDEAEDDEDEDEDVDEDEDEYEPPAKVVKGKRTVPAAKKSGVSPAKFVKPAAPKGRKPKDDDDFIF